MRLDTTAPASPAAAPDTDPERRPEPNQEPPHAEFSATGDGEHSTKSGEVRFCDG